MRVLLFQNFLTWLFGKGSLELTPAALSIFYQCGIAFIIVILALTFIRNPKSNASPIVGNFKDLPKEVRKKLGFFSANRSLFVWWMVFLTLASLVFGFHVYWTKFAEDYNERFQDLSYKDLRTRRTSAASLRGWMLDRSGNLGSSLAYYKRQPDGDIVRAYALESQMAHLLGSERGVPGLERTLFKKAADPTPESWEVLFNYTKKPDADRDVKITIDRDLQAYVAEQLKGKKGAVVVLNPQTGELIAMYSNPSYLISETMNQDSFIKLEGDKMNNPLLNRATQEFYTPGSTFKTFTMISAFRAGKEGMTFNSSPGGFVPYNGSRPILDANGGCEAPYGCSTLNIAQAFEASSNQFFSQMGVELGRERIRETAGLLGITAVDTPEEALQPKFLRDLWNGSTPQIQSALAPRSSMIVTGPKITNYDIGLEGMGQGYAGQMTPFQMAMVASAAGNLEGKLMRPKIEFDRPPQAFSQVLSPQQAAEVRNIMALVTEGSGGTATRVFGNVRAAGIRAGGKTGTAEKEAPIFDEKTGRMKMETRHRYEKGKRIEYQAPQMYERTDSWFICIAPLDKPYLAIAVVVEGGGYGAAVSAPIAANIILKARELGLLGLPKPPPPKTPAAPKPKAAPRKKAAR
jgi:penicillin-binding protein A